MKFQKAKWFKFNLFMLALCLMAVSLIVTNEQEIATAQPPTFQTIASGAWNNPAIWTPAGVPGPGATAIINAPHSVTTAAPINVGQLNNAGILQSVPWVNLNITANGITNTATGQLLGSPGVVCFATMGMNGSNVTLTVGGTMSNSGIISGGAGINCGQFSGNGGNVSITAGNFVSFAGSTINGGVGGNVLAVALPGMGGNGGNVTIFAPLNNGGVLAGGNGGNGNPLATAPQNGGNGGCVRTFGGLIANTGAIIGGAGGLGTGGGVNGIIGCVIIEPNSITVSGAGATLSGGDVKVFGGDDWIIQMNNLDLGAITADNEIILATGANGTVDLTNNTGQVFSAGQQVTIATDNILTDGPLTDVTGPNVVTTPPQILSDVDIAAPTVAITPDGVPTELQIAIGNGSPIPHDFMLSVSDTAGWGLDLQPSVFVDPLGVAWVTLMVTPPPGAELEEPNVITVDAVAMDFSTQASAQIQAVLE